MPSAADLGRMCVATSCEDARYLAHFDGARGWVAEVFTGAEWTRPGGELVISPDRRSFRLRQHVSDGYTEWLGYCAPSGS